MSNSLQCHGLYHAVLDFTVSWSLLRFMSIQSVMLSSHLILCCPLLLPSIFPSIRVFFDELGIWIKWPKYCSFSGASVLSMNIQSWFLLRLTGLISLQSKGLLRDFSISFKIDWLDLLAVQGTLKRLLQPHILKISIPGAQPSLSSNNSHIHTWLLEKPKLWLYRLLSAKWCLCLITNC